MRCCEDNNVRTSSRHATRALPILLAALAAATACGNSATAPTPAGSGTGSSSGSTSVPVSALRTIAEASTLEQVASGQTATSNNYLGQSVTIPESSSYNNVRFNWDGYTASAPTAPAVRGPLAVGHLFLLTQEYLGLPGGLGSSTPGYVAQSERIDSNQYVFPPSVTLNAGGKYWFYASWAPGSVAAGTFNPITGFSEDSYAGGDMYIAAELAGFTPQPFRKAAASWRVISLGPPIQYYIPPPGTYIDANFTLLGAPTAK